VTTSNPGLTLTDASQLVAAALAPRGPERCSVGLEVEWIVADAADSTRPVGADGWASPGPHSLPDLQSTVPLEQETT